jgi:hypothetical protein
MRDRLSEKLEQGRVKDGYYASSFGHLFGSFEIFGPCGTVLILLSSGDTDRTWEHVSVSCKNRCPNWQEMSFVKDLFWRDDELVFQFHPPKTDHINIHPYVLHLWRPTLEQIPMPPKYMV